MIVDKEYEYFLKDVESVIGHADVTFSTTLNDLCVYLFQHKFVGVFTKDQLPRHIQGYATANLDDSNEPGSHWVAIADNVIYDSFGRSLKGFGSRVRTEDDAEQGMLETNCGQRCVAWLLVFDNFGREEAILI
jgi:hypothetical protein